MAGNVHTWSVTAATNASADADVNWAEGQLPGTVNGSARGMMAGVAGWYKDTNGTITSGGSSNAYTITTNTTYAALATGLQIGFKANHTNTGAATLIVTPGSGSAFASKAIRTATDTALVAGQIVNTGQYAIRYDAAANGAAGAWLLIGGTGDVVGPASATDNAIARFDATTGRLLQNSGITVTDAGELLMPTMPAFLAYNTTQDDNVTGDGTLVTVGFDTEVIDRGADFSASTFTAPVTGIYWLSCAVLVLAVDAGHTLDLNIVTSNRTYRVNYLIGTAAAGGIIALGGSVLADMDSADTATVALTGSGGTKTIDLYGGASPYTSFSGHLVG